jgi:large repetitive protein
MLHRKLTLFIALLMLSSYVWGGDLKISWREGKDNLYNHPARLIVTASTNGQPAPGASIYRNEVLLGITDAKGQLSTTTLNTAAVKYILKACIKDKCSEKTTYQVLASEYPFPTFISMGEDPSNSMSFTWHTAEKTKITMVECVSTEDKLGFLSQSVIRAKGIDCLKELIDLDKPEGKRYTITIHKATLAGLSPDTKYIYRVGDGKLWSDGTFQTAPAPNPRESVKFLFVADSQESSRKITSPFSNQF